MNNSTDKAERLAQGTGSHTLAKEFGFSPESFANFCREQSLQLQLEDAETERRICMAIARREQDRRRKLEAVIREQIIESPRLNQLAELLPDGRAATILAHFKRVLAENENA